MLGDLKVTASTAKRLFGEKMGKNLVAAMDDGNQQTTAPLPFDDRDEIQEPWKLKTADIEVYGTCKMTLIDSAAIPDVMSGAVQKNCIWSRTNQSAESRWSTIRGNWL